MSNQMKNTMKKLTYLFGLGIIAAMFFTSCTDEDALPPSLQITSGNEVTAAAGSIITIEWRADAGDAKLSTFTITWNNVAIDDVDGNDWNDMPIDNADNETYVGSARVLVPDANAVFVLTVTDKDGNTASANVTVTVTAPLESIGSFQLGAGGSALGSYFSVSNEAVYKLAEAKANASSVDIVFNSTSTVATFKSPKDAAAQELIDANRTTLFKVVSYSFEDATAAQVDGESLSAEQVNVVAGDVVVFETDDGDRGIFVVDALTVATDGDVTIDIKIK